MERYTRTAMLLHWLIALAIVAQIGFGWYLQQIPRRTPDRTLYVNYHKSTGMLIGLLILARLAWRLKHKPPGLPASMPAWERRVARANHVLLYTCMIIMPRGAAAAGDWLYVSDQPNNRLILVDLRERKTAGAIALGVSPEGVGRSADGRWIAAASEQSNSVTFIDTQLQREAFTVKVQGQNPEHAMFRPDGSIVYVSAEDGDTVEVIDFDKRAQITQIKVGARPRGIGFLPDGSRAYVAAENADTVFAIDARAQKELSSIPAGKRSNGAASHPSVNGGNVTNGGAGAQKRE